MTEPLALADVQVTPGSWERNRYNIRFSVDQLARGVPQDIHRAQGGPVWRVVRRRLAFTLERG